MQMIANSTVMKYSLVPVGERAINGIIRAKTGGWEEAARVESCSYFLLYLYVQYQKKD